jgi:periplasmic glucans biosynthesis protein
MRSWLRRPAVTAIILMAAILLSPNTGTEPNAPQLTAQQRPATPAPAPGTASPAAPTAPAPNTAPVENGVFGFANVRQLAHDRAAHDYRPVPDSLPAVLANLNYDQYRDIRFRPESALWRGLSLFEVQFFHRGYMTRQRVNIFEVTAAGVSPIEYTPRLFTFGRLKQPKLAASLGFAGFRIHYPLQTPAYKDELLVFLGASYFRLLARNEHYGASARGLAIDTAAQSGEEFPTFTDFWLVRPHPSDRALTIYALLDSRSIAGAFQFDIRPGAITQVEVHSELYPRRAIAKLGIAPLTSMYFFGEDAAGRRFDDFRTEVHDSDGLMAQTGQGQWLWRPLGNPRELRVNRFMDESPKGFGLAQRQRDFSHYGDMEAQYQARPSYWVQPLGGWGKGGVEVVEIPSDEEIHDNIVAYWVSDQAVAAGKAISYSYLLSAFSDVPQWPPGGRVIDTRSGNPAMGDNKGHFPAGARRFVVDFAGGDLDGLEAAQPIRAEVSADNGHIETVSVQQLPTHAWRVAMVITPRAKKPVDLHCYLTLYGEVLSETWVYEWAPP